MMLSDVNKGSGLRWLGRIRVGAVRLVPTVLWCAVLVFTLRFHRTHSGTGVVVGHAETQTVNVSYMESGVIREVFVGLHDDVSPAQILLTMDDRQEHIALSAIQKDIERLTTEIAAEAARIEVANADATASTEDLRRRFLLDREDRHLEYLGLLIQDANDRVLLRGASTNYEIIQALYDQNDGVFRELNDIRTERDALSVQITAREPEIAEAKAAFETADRQWAQFVQHEAAELPMDRILDPLRLAIEVRQHDVRELVRRIDNHVLRSPIAGQVTFLSAAPGAVTQPGTALLTISAKSTNRVVAYLPEGQTDVVQIGDKVYVQPEAPGESGEAVRYAGVIESLSAVVDEVPMHDRPLAAVPSWGRAFIVALDGSVHLTPGQKVRVAMPGQIW